MGVKLLLNCQHSCSYLGLSDNTKEKTPRSHFIKYLDKHMIWFMRTEPLKKLFFHVITVYIHI